MVQMGVAGEGRGMLRLWGEGQCLGQRVLEGRPEGKRPRGIHNNRTADNIKIDLKEIAL
jgi:hypothetical protein